MPPYQGSGFWRGKLYKDLEELHLPGPSVVIDVRRGSDHDPALIWNLAAELEDLTMEMQMNQVYRWRHLSDFIDLIKLTPFHANQPVKDTTDFIITTSTGQHINLPGAEALVDNLGRYHLDRVRNNRISAMRDMGKEAVNIQLFPTTPEQITVRVFFIVDAEDTDSMVSAAAYAAWLKKWYREDEPKHSGRDRRVSMLAVCMNVDAQRHHPSVLAQALGQTYSSLPALDAVILMYTYGDDEAFIGYEIQSYQVECILYVLLLLSQENISDTGQQIIEDHHLSPYLYEGDYTGQPVIFWSVTLIGISSLEYSARWGARWLDYGLVTKIIEIMRGTEEVRQEELQGQIRREVQQKLQEWQQEVQQVVPGMLTEVIPQLRALDLLESGVSRSPFQGGLATSVRDFDLLTQRISQLYVGQDTTLQSAVESAALVVRQLKKASTQASGNIAASPAYEIYQRLMGLKAQAAQIPAALFHGTRGMLPRVLLQMLEMKEAISKIQEIAEGSLDLHSLSEQFELEARQARQQLERLRQSRRWGGLFEGKQHQQREEIVQRLRDVVRAHLQQVSEIIVARVMLVLLQEAGLYDPGGKICLYHQRIKRFDEAIHKAYIRASQEQESAYERLKASLSETQVGISQYDWFSLSSRKDLLQWERVVESFEQLYTYLEAAPTALNLLMEWLLHLIGTEKPLIITRQYVSKVKERQLLLTADQETKVQLQALSTMLVDVLLLLEIVNFDITAVQPLLTQYIDLRERSSEEPSVLESDILRLQRLVKEAMLEQATRNRQRGKHTANFVLKREQPIERVLAAWVSNQYMGDPTLIQIFGSDDILTRLAKNKISLIQALDDLRARNRVAGYRETLIGEDRFYLLLPPGEASDEFLVKERDLLYSSQIRPILFPDGEKLMYLHIHQIRHIVPVNPESTNMQMDQSEITQPAANSQTS